jgi:glycosyltransferase involved in cell wall biosynthesis
MAPLYQRADICVLTSDYEGTPNVLLEAMASGLPVVATNVGGIPDIVQDGVTGLVVERDDRDVLLAALAELVKDPTRRLEMGHRAREFVEAGHSLDRLPANLLNLYDLVLPPQRRWKLGSVEKNTA